MKKVIAILSAFLVLGTAAPAPAAADDPVFRFLKKMTHSSKSQARYKRDRDDDRRGGWSSNRNSNSSSNSSRNSSSNSNSNRSSNSSSNSNSNSSSNSSSNSNSNSSSNSSSDDD